MYGRTLGALEGLQRTLRSFTSIDLVSVGTLCSLESSFRTEPQNAQAVMNVWHAWFITCIVALA